MEVAVREKAEARYARIKDFIEKCYFEENRFPSEREIAFALGFDPGNLHRYIAEMKKSGWLADENGRRCIKSERMVKAIDDVVRTPLLGSVSCGKPLLDEENVETYLDISSKILGKGKFFALKANGDSMTGAGIADGDIVIVKVQSSASDGDIVVALCDGEEVTLKRYYKDSENRLIRLKAENPSYEDMLYEDVEIQGVAIKVIKSL